MDLFIYSGSQFPVLSCFIGFSGFFFLSEKRNLLLCLLLVARLDKHTPEIHTRTLRVVTASVYLLAEDNSGVAVAVIRRDSDHKTRFTERAPGWERNRLRAVAVV